MQRKNRTLRAAVSRFASVIRISPRNKESSKRREIWVGMVRTARDRGTPERRTPFRRIPAPRQSTIAIPLSRIRAVKMERIRSSRSKVPRPRW
jgi:hypothetical protein